MDDKILSFEEIKSLFPNEWVLLALANPEALAAKSGVVLLHGRDYLEICYKGSEVAKGMLTTIFYTGEKQKNRKWVKLPHKRIFGLAKGKIHLAPDFDAPLEDFKEYM